jgi:hypothetical protein
MKPVFPHSRYTWLDRANILVLSAEIHHHKSDYPAVTANLLAEMDDLAIMRLSHELVSLKCSLGIAD